MNTLIAVVLGAANFFLGYKYYAQPIDKNIIKADPKKATPAKMYMDGVDFSPANRNVLYGFQFKSIAAAGPITGVITAATPLGLAACSHLASAGRHLHRLGPGLCRDDDVGAP